MMTATTGKNELLKRAVLFLAGRCDYAQKRDDQGYNGVDAGFGHKLADMLLEGRDWTDKQAVAAYKMIRKYRGQLAEAGIDYDVIPCPVVEELKVRSDRQLEIIQGVGGRAWFVLRYSYDPRLVEKVKALPGRRWDAERRQWTVPMAADTVEKVMALARAERFTIAPGVEETATAVVRRVEENKALSKAADADIMVEGLGGELMPFQRAGVAYAVKAQRTFIADEQGLGKTVQALATVQALDAYPVLVICPAVVKLNWAREVRRWLPSKRVAVLNGGQNGSLPEADVYVVNYDLLKKWANHLEREWPAVVLDESQYVKNYKAKRTELAKRVAKRAKVRLLLTGTPVLNRPQELISQLEILGRLNELGGFWAFAKRYCGAYRGTYWWDLSGATHLDELNERLRATCFVRRLKADVLQELPEKRRALVPVEIDNEEEYRQTEASLLAWLRDQVEKDKAFAVSIANLSEEEQKAAKRAYLQERERRAWEAEELVRIEALKQVAVKGKLAAVKQWIADFVEGGEKLVVFAHHREVVEELAREFNAPTITGGDSAEARQAAVDRFQKDPDCRIIVLNMQAGGVGITLTAASNVAFVELGWTPATHDQAEDRCHRIGQRNAVTVWYLLAAGTIDEEIMGLLEEKRKVVQAAADGQAAAKGSGVFGDLLDRLMERTK